MNPIVVLWAHPRSRSTAMERIFIERGDFKVLHEPFSPLYYVLESKGTATAKGTFQPDSISYSSIRERILSHAQEGPVFIKDMPYHAFHHLKEDWELLDRMQHSFIIRHPASTLASHYAMNPNFTLEEAGYDQQYRLFELLRKMGKEPVVVDASQLTRDPENTLRSYCLALGIAFIPEALQWEQKTPEVWNTWAKWHQDAKQSQGIETKPKQYPHTVENTPHLKDFYGKCLPFYLRMKEYLMEFQ